MNQKYLYLWINILSIIFPLLASFYPKAPFYQKWKYAIPAIIIPAIPFIIWDNVFTQMGIWGFNEQYLSGIYVGKLPLEELLFFVCIPYACMFTYFALQHLIEKDLLFPHHELITSALVLFMLVLGMYHFEKLYTGITFVTLGLFLAYSMLKLKPRYMGRFYLTYLFIMIPFSIVNGVLTGSFIDEAVVWYNDNENLGIRLGTIPVEDIFYGMLLILMNVSLFEWLQERERIRSWSR